MSYPLTAAAIVTIGVAFAHSYLGERYIIRRLLRRENIPRLFGSDWFTKRTLRFAWHLTSVAWVGIAAIQILLAVHFGDPDPGQGGVLASGSDPMEGVGYVVAGILLVSAGLAAGGSRGRHLVWIAFLAASALTFAGTL